MALAEDVAGGVIGVSVDNADVSAGEGDPGSDVSVPKPREGAGSPPRGGKDDIASRPSVSDGVTDAVDEAGVVVFSGESGWRTALLETESEDMSTQTTLTGAQSSWLKRRSLVS